MAATDESQLWDRKSSATSTIPEDRSRQGEKQLGKYISRGEMIGKKGAI